uniref:Yeast cell wall synthesis Kre9/Knh1-like N-terminal domain-containing protein n=1 Tax=Bionectria ochroleuca TaxID=29856 RepID=A0A8H7KCR1_BIOOC
MHARSIITAFGLGFLALGAEARCKHSSRTAASVVTSATSVPSSSSVPVVSTTLQTSTRPATTASQPTTTSISLPKPEFFDPVFTPAYGAEFAYGSNLEITWGYDPYYEGTIKITLIGGPTQGTQQPLGVIASGLDNSLGKYTWTINNDFVGANAFYGFSILYEKDGVTSQYSNPFHINH